MLQTVINKIKAFGLFLTTAEKRYTVAQASLGYYAYEKGGEVEKDLKKALYWYTRAAEYGHEIASFNIGRFYEFNHKIYYFQDCSKPFLFFL